MALTALNTKRATAATAAAAAAALFLVSQADPAAAFVPSARHHSRRNNLPVVVNPTTPSSSITSSFAPLFSSATSDLPEISSMRAGEIKAELESYGISTLSFLEKSELIGALTKAREEGKTPIKKEKKKKKKKRRSDNGDDDDDDKAGPSGATREERIASEMETLKSKKASELKAELQSLGVSTKSFFEKSEFVRALAEARVDGVTKKSSGAGSAGGAVDEEGYAEYKAADVEVITNDSAGPRKRSQGQGQQQRGGGGGNPFGGAGGSPFGGGAGGPGGMGGMGGMDMGGIADMLKNMGMGGMGGGGGGPTPGANPFGGKDGSTPFGGANPFGGMGGGSGGGGMGGGMDDAFAKAQEMMKNPKVMELMQKAQSNPRIMSAMTECMSNPAAMSKYMNDPEIGPFMKEFQKLM